jgi:hypothetical protein
VDEILSRLVIAARHAFHVDLEPRFLSHFSRDGFGRRLSSLRQPSRKLPVKTIIAVLYEKDSARSVRRRLRAYRRTCDLRL